MVKYYEVKEYENFGRCLAVTNGVIEAYVSIDVGPRILRFGFVGGQNMMQNEVDRATQWKGAEYDAYYGEGTVAYLYGGHRIWITPERAPETYYPDNEPVEVTYTDNGVCFTPDVQRRNDIQLSLEIVMHPEKAEMQVFNRVKNMRDEAREFAVWTVSAMNLGGLEIIPHSTLNSGYLPNRVLSLWSYSKANDPRFYNGERYMSFRQDPAAIGSAFKLGTNNVGGKVVYALGDEVFRKEYAPHDPSKRYEDGGVSFETYISAGILEMEALGPVERVGAGETAELSEKWSLVKCDGTPDAKDDESLDRFWNAVWQA